MRRNISFSVDVAYDISSAEKPQNAEEEDFNMVDALFPAIGRR
jgi:hypothetical protein